ncbi:gluconate 2-dehydrogenase subunit 3 family protein [Aquabacterium sp. NJ1]|uniref:gluconate 2-dehydrogenase subunit 3 family protein n=1 Tax=Aquabacterium sp. NJ1 TaxID=1538295 RepID=UPI00126A51F5|nr:gluconate 2-dehydrogenase subunit 3 family protein [Aquabacterium sp. NJ1]
MSVRSFSTWPSLPELRRRWFLRALLAAGPLGWLARADAKVARNRSPGNKPLATMPPALTPFIDHLIPADEWTPAASALHVPQTIWQQAQTDAELQHLIHTVCAWLDRYGDGFAALSADEREALVAWMAQAPWEAPQRRFFHWMRERAFMLYYTQPQALKGLPVQRPPQPMGHVLD